MLGWIPTKNMYHANSNNFKAKIPNLKVGCIGPRQQGLCSKLDTASNKDTASCVRLPAQTWPPADLITFPHRLQWASFCDLTAVGQQYTLRHKSRYQDIRLLGPRVIESPARMNKGYPRVTLITVSPYSPQLLSDCKTHLLVTQSMRSVGIRQM